MKITSENVKSLFESKFINIADIEHAPDQHYLVATRNSSEDIVATKTRNQFQNMHPDAVTCIVIVHDGVDNEPLLLLSYEYRYPVGQYLLSPPAGLIDAEDKIKEDAILITARREVYEETGLDVSDAKIRVVNPCVFSSPGLTDESNALVCIEVIDPINVNSLTRKNATGTEMFDEFRLLTKQAARSIILHGRDGKDMFYPIYTWAAMMYFISGLWENQNGRILI